MIDNCFIKEIQERHGSQVDLDLSMKAHGIPAEEADSVLDAFAEFVFRCTAPDTEKVEREGVLKAIAATPDPQPGHTGCEDCDHDLRDVAECERCSPPPAPIAPALKEKYNPPEPKHGGSQGHKGNKYGIPIEVYRTDKRKYNRLWSLCKTHGLMYEQALTWKKLPSRTKGDGKQGKKKERLPLHLKNQQPDTVKPSAQAIAPSNEVKEPAPAIVETTTWPGQAKLRELTKAQNGTLHVGQRVKHNGSKASPYFGQVGEITAINKEMLHVTFPSGSTRLPAYLVLAMPEPAGGAE